MLGSWGNHLLRENQEGMRGGDRDREGPPADAVDRSKETTTWLSDEVSSHGLARQEGGGVCALLESRLDTLEFGWGHPPPLKH